MRNDICTAIKSLKVLQFSYGGGIRIVEPFCMGIHKNTGNVVLSGFQIGGYSESGNSIGWKLFRITDISNLTIGEQCFNGVRPGYNKNDSRMTEIICRVE